MVFWLLRPQKLLFRNLFGIPLIDGWLEDTEQEFDKSLRNERRQLFYE